MTSVQSEAGREFQKLLTCPALDHRFLHGNPASASIESITQSISAEPISSWHFCISTMDP
ncbi:hypothetical protein BofuT4_uP081450.1 [Botrytis cinerea T4]|uniref:Uncharacterized protein n=1 Tax=Botryotinia fuckeliana (strain T4) TaxID=999810 RepID=G2YK38_BOTF4|nr:hypothetical protein BofuT4_uP081450.1 [Botrytis cinerea T4]